VQQMVDRNARNEEYVEINTIMNRALEGRTGRAAGGSEMKVSYFVQLKNIFFMNSILL